VNTITILLLFILSFLPPLIYAIWIRNTEQYHREKWKPILLSFLWGATIAILAALILEIILHIPIVISFKEAGLIAFLTAVLVAPFAEELTKPMILRYHKIKKELDEPEDGLIYGAVAGLGFSATENLLYGLIALQESIEYFLFLILVRSIAGCLLHASATAWTGYGYGQFILKKTSFFRVIPFLFLAIIIHSFYNFIVSYELIGAFAALFFALIFVLFSIHIVRSKIRLLDQKTR